MLRRRPLRLALGFALTAMLAACVDDQPTQPLTDDDEGPLETDMSARHLSFIETGRSRPSTAMLQRIADRLEIPHRARNGLLLAAGYAPDYPERPLDSPEMAGMKAIVEHVLKQSHDRLFDLVREVCLHDVVFHGRHM